MENTVNLLANCIPGGNSVDSQTICYCFILVIKMEYSQFSFWLCMNLNLVKISLSLSEAKSIHIASHVTSLTVLNFNFPDAFTQNPRNLPGIDST